MGREVPQTAHQGAHPALVPEGRPVVKEKGPAKRSLMILMVIANPKNQTPKKPRMLPKNQTQNMTPKGIALLKVEIPGASAEVKARVTQKILQENTPEIGALTAVVQENGMMLQETILSVHMQNPQEEKKVNQQVQNDLKKSQGIIGPALNFPMEKRKDTELFSIIYI